MEEIEEEDEIIPELPEPERIETETLECKHQLIMHLIRLLEAVNLEDTRIIGWDVDINVPHYSRRSAFSHIPTEVQLQHLRTISHRITLILSHKHKHYTIDLKESD